MFLVKRRGNVGYEDLMRELSAISQSMMTENSSTAMDLMVLEAKLRERFEQMEGTAPRDRSIWPFLDDEMSPEEVRALIPIDNFESIEGDVRKLSKRRGWETVGTAAVLALVTALGVLGLASVIQLTLSWLV